jgi:hypothetical protein
MRSLILRALISGSLAAATTTLAAALAGRHATGSYAAPINATSHILWGEAAAYENTPSIKYTATGLLLNHGVTIFWAVFYEMLSGGVRVARGRALLDGALVSTAAYIIDYYVVPRRLTPGFELRLSGKGLRFIYSALAAGLCIRDVLTRQPALKARAEDGLQRILQIPKIQIKRLRGKIRGLSHHPR